MQWWEDARTVARFRAKFEVGDSARCWPWLARRSGPMGYGALRVDETHKHAHRLMWEITHRQSLVKGENVLHSCDNPPCVNPAHLRVGSHDDNMRDKVERNRQFHPRGIVHSQARITDDDVREIRRLLSLREGRPRQWQLAERYGLTQSHISAIKLGKKWGHVA